MEKKMFNKLNHQYHYLPSFRRNEDIYQSLVVNFMDTVNYLVDDGLIEYNDFIELGHNSGLQNLLDYSLVFGVYKVRFTKCKCCGIHSRIVFNKEKTIENILFCIENTKVRWKYDL